MYRHHQFSGDPHPGNFLLLDDGRMAFLDFGLFKRITAEAAEFELAEPARSGIERRRASELIAHLHRRRLHRRARATTTDERILAQFHDVTWWYTRDEEIELDAGDRDRGDDRHERPALARTSAQMRHETLPPDHLFGRRLEMLTLAVHRPAARDAATGTGSRASGSTATTPVTELGRQEAAFYARART